MSELSLVPCPICARPLGSDEEIPPVVPCDDAAVERAAKAVNTFHESNIGASWRDLVTVAFRAAGKA